METAQPLITSPLELKACALVPASGQAGLGYTALWIQWLAEAALWPAELDVSPNHLFILIAAAAPELSKLFDGPNFEALFCLTPLQSNVEGRAVY